MLPTLSERTFQIRCANFEMAFRKYSKSGNKLELPAVKIGVNLRQLSTIQDCILDNLLLKDSSNFGSRFLFRETSNFALRVFGQPVVFRRSVKQSAERIT